MIVNSIRPNPFVSELTVSMVLEKSLPVIATMIDAAGKTIRSYQLKGTQGLNNFNFNGLEHLSKGMYIIKLQVGDQLLHEKVIKF